MTSNLRPTPGPRPGRNVDRNSSGPLRSTDSTVISCLLVVLIVCLLGTESLTVLLAQPAKQPTTLPPGARPLTIVVESTRGTIRYRRARRFRRLTRRTRLQRGDLLVLDPASTCRLRFELSPPAQPGADGKKAADHVRNPIRPVNFQDAPVVEGENAVSAIVLRGYTEITIAEAYHQGAATRTQLDMRQGIIRAGVVRTAVPPSFRIRTPRTVVAVRGTEIRQLEASSDRGDFLQMGRIGAVTSNDKIPLSRSVQFNQSTQKRVASDPRISRLTRAIETAVLDGRLVIRSPHKGGLESDQARRQGHDPLVFSKAEPLKTKGNPKFDANFNSGPKGGSGGEGGGGRLFGGGGSGGGSQEGGN